MIKGKNVVPKAAVRGGKGTKNPKKARASTAKLSRLEALLRRPEGATIAQQVSWTGSRTASSCHFWQPKEEAGIKDR